METTAERIVIRRTEQHMLPHQFPMIEDIIEETEKGWKLKDRELPNENGFFTVEIERVCDCDVCGREFYIQENGDSSKCERCKNAGYEDIRVLISNIKKNLIEKHDDLELQYDALALYNLLSSMGVTDEKGQPYRQILIHNIITFNVKIDKNLNIEITLDYLSGSMENSLVFIVDTKHLLGSESIEEYINPYKKCE